jgi:calcineurin-like phosphoesterase family protein
MSKVWFTADTHFGHANIIKFSKRPFADVKEMDEALIQNWNDLVGPNDVVWHLGDFGYRNNRTARGYAAALHGQIHIVWGNHDDKSARLEHQKQPIFASAQDYKYLRLNGEKITLLHYGMRVWRNSHHGAWHLYGHSHGTLPAHHRSFDVGVDAQNYRPVEFDEVKAYMDKQPITLHHPELTTDPWDKTETVRNPLKEAAAQARNSLTLLRAAVKRENHE